METLSAASYRMRKQKSITFIQFYQADLYEKNAMLIDQPLLAWTNQITHKFPYHL